MATTTDFYAESNHNGTTAAYLSSTEVLKAGQAFTCDHTGTLHAMKFHIKKYGSPTGNIVATLYALDAGTYGSSAKPTGSALATSSAVSIAGLTTSYALTTFTFDDSVQVTATSKYAAVIEYSGGDANNDLCVAYDATGEHDGNFVYYQTSWVPSSTDDIIFYVDVTEGGDLTITHAFVSAKDDTADDTVLQPSDWNADHVITGGIDDTFTVDGVTYTIVSGFVTAAE